MEISNFVGDTTDYSISYFEDFLDENNDDIEELEKEVERILETLNLV